MDNNNPIQNQQILALNSDDPTVKREAVEGLMQEELDEMTLKALCSLLQDPDKGVRDSCSFTLIYNGNPLIPRYVVPYVSSPDISIRNLAGEVLLKIGENSIDDLISFMEQSKNDDDIKFVIDIIGLIGNSKPVTSILRILEKNTNDNVILACFEALGNIGYADALPVLIKFYESNELYKPTIIEAMGKMNSKVILEFITSKYHVEGDLTRFSIIESLGLIGDESTFFFLLGELSRIKGPLVWVIISSLYSLKEKMGLDLPFDESIKNSILYTLLEAETKYKRAAANLITIYDDKDILEALLKIYGEDGEIDESIKSAFYQFPALIFGKISPLLKSKPLNIKNLLWLLKDLNDTDSGKDLNELSALEKHNLSDALSMCLDNPDEEVRKASIELLFSISLETALLFIDTMIEDDNLWNRLKILEIIENVFNPCITEVLKKLINDPEEMVRERAEWILSQRGITNFEIKA